MVNYFIILFDNIHYERSLIFLLSLTDSNILIQSGFKNDEIEIIKNIALENMFRQRNLNGIIALDLLDII